MTVSTERHGHIPSLDGVRALSIFLVIALHLLQRRSLAVHVPTFYFVLADGGLGVFIFFVISGYLITTLLLREQARAGAISLGRFYIRRAFRILPPLYLYLITMALLAWSGHLPGLGRGQLLTAFTFTSNYIPFHNPIWAFEHLWSLCIEEQFYLLWPAVLVFSLTRSKVENQRRFAAKIVLGVIVAEPLIRVVSYHFLPHFHSMAMFHMLSDGLMFGALGALLQGDAQFEAIYRRAARWPWLLTGLLFFGSGALGMIYQNYWNLPIGLTIDGALALLWLVWLIRNPHSLQGRLLNLPAVAWVGRLSYSMYIWQTFFIHASNIDVFRREGWYNTFPGNLVCILGIATFSYYCIEQPALRLRDRIIRHMNLAKSQSAAVVSSTGR